MSKIKLANDLKRLLPGQANSRIRQAIMEAYQRATGAPSLNPEYYQSNITNIVQQVITEVVGVVAPDGIIVYGGVEQDGNDLIFDTEWQWRRSGVAYKLIEETTIPIPPTDVGYTRTDIVVGTMAGTFIRVAGTPVELPTVAAPPTLPADTIPIVSVDVSDIGITNFIEFALSSFVRFDVKNQDLNPVQRQNARTNIQALGKDINEVHTGNFTNTGGLFHIQGGPPQGYFRITMTGNSGSSKAIKIDGDEGGNADVLFVTARGELFVQSTSGQSIIVRNRANGNQATILLHRNGFIRHEKSTSYQDSVRRDELITYYQMTVVDGGQLDNLVLSADAKLLILTNADDLTGIEMEANRKLKIFNNTGGNLTIHAESTASIAANRFATGTVIPEQGFLEVIKIGTRIRLA